MQVHNLMLNSIMNSPMAFFDVTPSGQILNRFSKDMDESESIAMNNFICVFPVDTRIPFLLEAVFQYSLMCISQVMTASYAFTKPLQVLLVCVLYPYFIIGFIVIIGAFFLLDLTMNSGVLEAKKLDNMMKSPVIHHISSSMAGVIIIRGFGKEEVFKSRCLSSCRMTQF